MLVDTRLTYDDYCLLPNNGRRYEIIDGELFSSPSPGRAHQHMVTHLSASLGDCVNRVGEGEVYVGPFDVVFSRHDVVKPDILYVSKERASVVTEDNVQGAPDLVVEVLSATTAKVDRTTKLKLYARYGVQEYWLIDPEECTAEIYRRKARGFARVASLQPSDSLTTPLLPGFSVLLHKLVE
ncbi:MAG TPA: Uma2 family endonuclease [Terriglobia bacterium]|nr:Uma2 family endonuclease [Terriglobia bacterium]